MKFAVIKTRTFILLITLVLFVFTTSSAQNIQPGAAICPECGVELKGDQMKHFDNPNYHKAGCTWIKKKLRDVAPMSEVPSNFSQADRQRLYGYGNGLQCPHCLGTQSHKSDCVIGYSQRRAKELLQEAEQTTSESARKRAIWQYQNMENNINILAQAAQSSHPEPQPSQTQTAPSAPSSTHVVSPGAYIMQNYDKKLSFAYDDSPRAFGATMPNGTERWLLTNAKGEEVGQFTKVEFVEANGINQYILVRDDHAHWSIYSDGGKPLCEPRYESVKMLSAVVNDAGGRVVFFDVTKRDDRGVLKHGLFDPETFKNGEALPAEIIPCEYDFVELIDRSIGPSGGTLVKVRKNGLSGIIETFSEEIVIPIAYSYINTYFTLKGGMYLIVGDGNGLGAYHAVPYEQLRQVVPVTNGYSLDKVKSIIEQE